MKREKLGWEGPLPPPNQGSKPPQGKRTKHIRRLRKRKLKQQERQEGGLFHHEIMTKTSGALSWTGAPSRKALNIRMYICQASKHAKGVARDSSSRVITGSTKRCAIKDQRPAGRSGTRVDITPQGPLHILIQDPDTKGYTHNHELSCTNLRHMGDVWWDTGS